ncbi:MAG TPA: lactate utilization protein [Aggregatilineaceae bacterium]|nr:lactate utilization protein [Aggregatilineaceae bacterium]
MNSGILDYDVLATQTQIERTAAAVKARGIEVEVVNTGADALRRIKQLIPAGATLTTGASITLQEIGLEALLVAKTHPWVNLKDAMLAETDPVKQMELRRQSTLAEYFLGSVHAIAETGEMVVASATGSQLPSYAFASPNVIWVAGVQKITPTLDDAMQRVREYNLPREEQHMKEMGYPGSMIGKLLIFEREAPYLNRHITLILVKEILGV